MRRLPLLLALLVLSVGACKDTKVPAGGAGAATAMGDWGAWQDLSPLLEVAENHAGEPTLAALREASALLRASKPASADKVLAKAADGAGRDWIAVARGNVAAMNFSLCIRGVAWRLEDGKRGSDTDREADYSEETRILAGDISVEAALTNLDAVVASPVEALSTQGRIARARVAAFANRCAPNADVADLAQQTLEADLATLAAEAQLTPDLAYLWAGVQMSRFSGSAARPFLLQAKEGGFDHPAVTYMLGVIALESRDLDLAAEYATAAIKRYAELEDPEQEAQAHFLRGEVAAARDQPKAARAAYEAALKRMPTHVPSLLQIATVLRDTDGDIAATTSLWKALPRFWPSKEPLDAETAREGASNLEALVIMTEEPHLAQMVRDALLQDIDVEKDAMRRGIRYFFAATLEVRLREYDIARGHGVLAKEEFAESDVPPPIDVQAFLDRLAEAAG
jgi:tetratricopeptide (TPR) repeat protein